MARRFSGKSTITPHTIASTEPAVEGPKSYAAEEAAPFEHDFEPAEKEPEVLSTGLVEGIWSGKQFWHCPKCGRDEFSRSIAEIHVCKGRIVKPYKGE